MISCSHIDPPPLYNQYKFRAHLSPPHLTPTTRLLSLPYARVRLCTKLKVISENSDYGISSGSHLEFFVPVWSSKSHEISGKKPLEHWRPLLLPLLLLWLLAGRILAKGVTKHITCVWKSWLQFDYRFFTFSFRGMQMLNAVVTLNLFL